MRKKKKIQIENLEMNRTNNNTPLKKNDEKKQLLEKKQKRSNALNSVINNFIVYSAYEISRAVFALFGSSTQNV